MSILLSHVIWLVRTRKIRKRAKEAETSWEDFPEAQEWENNRWTREWNWWWHDNKEGDKGSEVEQGDIGGERMIGVQDIVVGKTDESK